LEFRRVLFRSPFIIYASRYNWKPTLLIIVLALVLSLLFATIVSLPLTLIASLGGLAIGTAIYNKDTSHQTWAKGTPGFIIGLLLVSASAQLCLGVNWTEELSTILDESLMMSEWNMSDYVSVGQHKDKTIQIRK